MAHLRKILSSFDGQERVAAEMSRPDRWSHLRESLSSHPQVICRGAGLSYVLNFAGESTLSFDLSSFNRILGFDSANKKIRVEPSLTLGSLLEFLIPQKLWFPVLPGHPQITVGGALACDVHGKSQFHWGNFSDHVESLTLFHPDQGEIFCDRQKNSEVFSLTLGGFGWTGVVTSVELKLQKLAGNQIQRKTIPVKNFFEGVQVLVEQKKNFDQVYSWHNFRTRGASWGRGFIYGENFLPPSNSIPSIPMETPRELNSKSFPWTSETGRRGKAREIMGQGKAREKKLEECTRHRSLFQILKTPAQLAVCSVYESLEALRPRTQCFDLFQGAFPILGKEIFYHSFGSRGFFESQVIVPWSHWEDWAVKVQKLIEEYQIQINLASLKIFKGEQKFLRFSSEGLCLALDFPWHPRAHEFLARLDALVIEVKGLPNLYKDSRLSADVVKRSYLEYSKFKQQLHRWDPCQRFQSTLRQRLEL